MKKLFYLLFASMLVVATVSCNKEEEPSPEDTCANGIKDGTESEIDCGGPCEACPPPATFNADFMGFNYVASSVTGYWNGNGLRIHTEGTGDADIYFNFVGTTLNTPLPITDASAYFDYDNYHFSLNDTGHVVLTHYDGVRRIMSGTVSFSADYYGDKITVKNGVFNNVRYSN